MPNGTELHVGFLAPQSKHICTSQKLVGDNGVTVVSLTLLADLVLSFSKILIDSDFVANAILAK
jgi:hypothetical protein